MASKKKTGKATKPKGARNAMQPPPTPPSTRPGPSMPPPHRSSSAAPSNVLHRPTSEINVSEQASFELARVVMTATISTIACLRKIFPTHRWAVRTYDCANPETNYDAFMLGTKFPFTFEPSDDLVNWRILSRSTNDLAVNKLLDWIEISATDALEKKYLHKLQLAFHSIDGPLSDDNLLEAYTICFTYENGELHVGTAEGNDTPTNSVILRDAKQGVYSLVQDVCLSIQRRAPLPADRRMNMMLLYNSTCPPNYQPPGFHATLNKNRLIADTNTGTEMGLTNTGFHGVSVNVYEQDRLPNSQNQVSSKRRRISLRNPSMSSEVNEGETQEHGLKLLQGMGNSRGGETQDTQIVGGTTNERPVSLNNPPTSQDLIPAFLPYSQTVMERINQKHAGRGVRQEYDDLDEPQSSGLQVTCECGASADEGRLMQCDICDQFKHIQCYGHLDPVRPSARFACYSCLLEIETTLLEKMKLTCVKRRALYYLHEQHGALDTIEDLARYLDCDDIMTKNILGDLEREGYVKRAAGYEKASKGKGRSKGKATEPLFSLIADDKMLLDTIFRPELDIPHKLQLPISTSPGSATLSENCNEASEQSPTLNSIGLSPSSDPAKDPVPFAQANFAEASSTEGTPSPRSSIARRFSGRRIQTPGPSSFGNSHPSRKRVFDSTPEPNIDRPAHHQAGVSGVGTDQGSFNGRKLSEVNSPWTFRSTAL